MQIFKKIEIVTHQVYKVEEETDIFQFALNNNSTPAECIFESQNLKKGHYVVVKPRNYIIHIVRPNQTIDDIAKIYNVEPESILKNNNVQTIFVGEQLKI